jgi:hypothetical protein
MFNTPNMNAPHKYDPYGYVHDPRGVDHEVTWLGAMRPAARMRYAKRLQSWELDAAERYGPGSRLEAARGAFVALLQAERSAEIALHAAERARGRDAKKHVKARAEYKEAAERQARALDQLIAIESLPDKRRGDTAGAREASALSRIRGAGVADDLL